MADAEVTILIPNYKTPEMTRLCLRLLRRHTDLERVQVVVIDNGSGDASLDYLRGVNWIRLIERPEAAKEKGPEMHARALDLALKEVTTPYVLVMHTDTLICNDGWLDFLLGKISGDETVAGVGSWKLEEPPSACKQFGKKIESLLRRLLGKKTKVEERYLRSHCALYRTELIRKRTNGFFGDQDQAAGFAVSVLDHDHQRAVIRSPLGQELLAGTLIVGRAQGELRDGGEILCVNSLDP